MPSSKVFLTQKQRAVVDFIEQRIADTGDAPTLREIGKHFGISAVTALQHLRALEKKKVVARARYAQRRIDIREDLLTRGRLPRVDLPIAGQIRAGAPIEPRPAAEAMNLSSLVETRKECVLLRVVGDSMIEDNIREGDLLIVERRDWAKDGEVVVAVLPSGEALLKRWFREADGVRLQPASSSVAPIKVDAAKVWGVAVGLVRKWAK